MLLSLLVERFHPPFIQICNQIDLRGTEKCIERRRCTSPFRSVDLGPEIKLTTWRSQSVSYLLAPQYLVSDESADCGVLVGCELIEIDRLELFPWPIFKEM